MKLSAPYRADWVIEYLLDDNQWTKLSSPTWRMWKRAGHYPCQAAMQTHLRQYREYLRPHELWSGFSWRVRSGALVVLS